MIKGKLKMHQNLEHFNNFFYTDLTQATYSRSTNPAAEPHADMLDDELG
jgi:hypothetical protein